MLTRPPCLAPALPLLRHCAATFGDNGFGCTPCTGGKVAPDVGSTTCGTDCGPGKYAPDGELCGGVGPGSLTQQERASGGALTATSAWGRGKGTACVALRVSVALQM